MICPCLPALVIILVVSPRKAIEAVEEDEKIISVGQFGPGVSK
jgi:hypothetical protein